MDDLARQRAELLRVIQPPAVTEATGALQSHQDLIRQVVDSPLAREIADQQERLVEVRGLARIAEQLSGLTALQDIGLACRMLSESIFGSPAMKEMARIATGWWPRRRIAIAAGSS